MLLVGSLVAGACSGTSGGDAKEPKPTGNTVPVDTPAADTGAAPKLPADFERAMATAGIETVADVTVDPPPYAFTDWQMQTMAAGAEAGSGVLGADLDRALATPAGAPPMSYFIGAWVSTAPTPAARLAGDLLGERDWTHAPQITFPMAVLALFVHDAVSGDSAVQPAAFSASGELEVVPASVRIAPPAARPARIDGAGATRSARSTPCSSIATFVNQTLSDLFDKIKLDPKFLGDEGVIGAIGGFFAFLYNTAVDLAKNVVKGLLQVLTAPFVKWLGTAIGAVAVITQIASQIVGWKVTVEPDRPQYTYWVGVAPGRGDQGKWTATGSGLADEWPEALKDCAKETGVPVPSAMAVGSKADWTVTNNEGDKAIVPPPLTSIVGAARTTSLPFEATTEDAKVAASRIVRTASVQVQVEMDSANLVQLKNLAKSLIKQIPAVVLGPVAEVGPIKDVIDKLLAPLTLLIDDERVSRSLLGLTGNGFAFINYHEAEAPDDTTTTTTTPPKGRPACGVSAADAKKALGGAFRTKSSNRKSDGTSVIGDCWYYSDPLAVTLEVVNLKGPIARQAYEKATAGLEATQPGSYVKEVAGLGDKAVLSHSSGDLGVATKIVTDYLWVLKGDHYVAIILGDSASNVSSRTVQPDQGSYPAVAKALARQALTVSP